MYVLKVLTIFSLLLGVGSASCIDTLSNEIKKIDFNDDSLSVHFDSVINPTTITMKFDTNDKKKMIQGIGSLILATKRAVKEKKLILKICENKVSVYRELDEGNRILGGPLTTVSGYVQAIKITSTGETSFKICNSHPCSNRDNIYKADFKPLIQNNIVRSYLVPQILYALLYKQEINLFYISSTGSYKYLRLEN